MVNDGLFTVFRSKEYQFVESYILAGVHEFSAAFDDIVIVIIFDNKFDLLIYEGIQ